MAGADGCGRGDGGASARHDRGGAAAVLALFMALINASIKPMTQLIALPFSILTFGLLYLVINWLFMRLASWLAISLFGVGVLVHGFWWAVLGSLIMSIVSGIVGSIVRD